jgi:peptidoglycan biosynthesis protein MviN/MurJ (putative lipid II flippase)
MNQRPQVLFRIIITLALIEMIFSLIIGTSNVFILFLINSSIVFLAVLYFLSSRNKKVTVRGWSWILGIASIVVPVCLYFYYNWRFSCWDAQWGDLSCGFGLAGVFLLSLLLASVLSFLALLSALIGFRRLPRPRPIARLVEALLLGSICLPAFMYFRQLLLS